MKIREDKGITLISLIIIIIVLIIIAGITIYNGNDTITQAKLEELRTNMLLIQAKAKGYVEEVNFEMGPSKDETKKQEAIQKIYLDELGLKKADDTSLDISLSEDAQIDLSVCYYLTDEALEYMGLDKIETDKKKKEAYLIQFNEEEAKVVEIYNTIGYNGIYSLTGLEQIEK